MRPLLRRALFPILIVAVAGGLTLFTKSQAEWKRATVARFVEEALHGGSWGATAPLIVDRVRPLVAGREGLQVEVRDGDGGPAPDGSASHVAMLRKDGLAWLGLRCRYDSDPSAMAIVGYFEP